MFHNAGCVIFGSGLDATLGGRAENTSMARISPMAPDASARPMASSLGRNLKFCPTTAMATPCADAILAPSRTERPKGFSINVVSPPFRHASAWVMWSSEGDATIAPTAFAR